MTRRDLARIRLALHSAIDALIDSLESSQPANTVTRPPRQPDADDVSDLDSAEAERIIQRHGIR